VCGRQRVKAGMQDAANGGEQMYPMTSQSIASRESIRQQDEHDHSQPASERH